MSKPGVMFYFDVRPCIKRLNLNEKGQLFEAILDYAESGIEPELDGALGIAWDFIQPRIDLDSEQYELKVEGSQYAAFSRERKKLGLDELKEESSEIMNFENEYLRLETEFINEYEKSLNDFDSEKGKY